MIEIIENQIISKYFIFKCLIEFLPIYRFLLIFVGFKKKIRFRPDDLDKVIWITCYTAHVIGSLSELRLTAVGFETREIFAVKCGKSCQEQN